MILAIKCDPRSDEITAGTPNLGIIFCNSTLVTSLALLVREGNASGHPEKVSVKTNRYRNPLFLGVQRNQFATAALGNYLSRFVLFGL